MWGREGENGRRDVLTKLGVFGLGHGRKKWLEVKTRKKSSFFDMSRKVSNEKKPGGVEDLL